MKIDIDDEQNDRGDSLPDVQDEQSAEDYADESSDNNMSGEEQDEPSETEPTEPSDRDKSVPWLKRYVSLLSLGVMAAIVYMLFFSDTSVLHKIEYQRIIDSLQTEVEINRDSMLYYKELNSRLSSDPAVMERVVREQHNMKRPDEDVYVFSAE